jgi:type IX secretion system PorP/SprF family membrane protein
MTIKTGWLSLLTLIASLTICQGQDPVFSQITSHPLLINPAYAGLFNGEIRASIQFKNHTDLPNNQYLNQMSAFGIDTRYKAGNKDFWTLQGLITSYKIGDPSFINQEISIGGGYMKLLKAGRYGKGTQYLSLAFQIGAEQNYLGNNNWYSNQYDSGTGSINFALPNGEPNNGQYTSSFIPDLNAGLLWSNSWDSEKGIYAGLSVFHLNNPKNGFIPNSNSRIPRKITFVTGGEFLIMESTQFLPTIFYLRQGSQQRISLGTPIRFNPRDWKDNALRAGIWLHGSQKDIGNWHIGELSFQTIFEIKTIHIGLAYAVGNKPINTGNFSRNSFEINVTWIKPAHYKKKIACPRL